MNTIDVRNLHDLKQFLFRHYLKNRNKFDPSDYPDDQIQALEREVRTSINPFYHSLLPFAVLVLAMTLYVFRSKIMLLFTSYLASVQVYDRYFLLASLDIAINLATAATLFHGSTKLYRLYNGTLINYETIPFSSRQRLKASVILLPFSYAASEYFHLKKKQRRRLRRAGIGLSMTGILVLCCWFILLTRLLNVNPSALNSILILGVMCIFAAVYYFRELTFG